MQLYPDYWQRLHLLDHRPSSAGCGGGVGGLDTYRLASLATLGIGTINLHDIGTSFEPLGIDSINQTAMLRNLGDGIISRFHVIIDSPNRRISLIPTPMMHAPVQHELVGLETEPEGKLVKVFFVMPNLPAATAGFKVGDKIIAVAGLPVQYAKPDDWLNGEAGEPIKFTLSDGTSKTILPARFY